MANKTEANLNASLQSVNNWSPALSPTVNEKDVSRGKEINFFFFKDYEGT